MGDEYGFCSNVQGRGQWGIPARIEEYVLILVMLRLDYLVQNASFMELAILEGISRIRSFSSKMSIDESGEPSP